MYAKHEKSRKYNFVKEKTFISEAGQRSPKTRGEVAAQEQIRVLGQVLVDISHTH